MQQSTDTTVDVSSAGTASHQPESTTSHSAFEAVNQNTNADANDTKDVKPEVDVESSNKQALQSLNVASAAQPATSSAQTSSQSITQNVDDTDTLMIDASYGTRSRNRTSTRPNYAEDQQDLDFEISTSTSGKGKKASEQASALSNGSASDSKRMSDAAAAASASTNGGANDVASHQSTPAPAAPSKKRKAAAPASSFNDHASTTSTTASNAQANSAAAAIRKTGLAAQSLTAREFNTMTFHKHKNCLNKKGEFIADDGTKLMVNDCVYLVCEPPGDPYYLCRIMEFLHVEADNPLSPVDSLRVNWYYRPRDVARFSTDTRLVFATMHSDMCPVTSLRGKCMIKHRSEIEDLELYRKERDAFYFVQAFDRFIRRSYECIPVKDIINVPERVKKALDERWRFVIVETSRVKELTSAAKTCKRCGKYCASQESVDCAICKNAYHMNCVQPPLPKKPSRGFAWACGPCSRASERKMEARNTPTLSANGTEDEEMIEEEEVIEPSSDTTRAPSPSGDEMVIDDHPATQAEIDLMKMWPMRYLGIHCRVEDALQYDDRAIYPRASSRLGPRHQATVIDWPGRSVELVKPVEIKKKYNKGNASKKDAKLTKETIAAIEADREERAKRPKWVQDEPAGYVARGEDYDRDDPRCTAVPLFKMPEVKIDTANTGEYDAAVRSNRNLVSDYLKEARNYSRKIGVPPFGANFIDKALELLYSNDYNVAPAIDQLSKVDRKKDLHEPVLTKTELAKFEEGVAKYGSEHRLVRLHMKTSLPHADIVRFYYLWKKTPKGREIWGNYGGRKKRKLENDAGAKLHAEVAHDADDSAFDGEKAAKKHRGFQCKFCQIQYSRQWRRAPGVSPGQTVLVERPGGNKEKKDRALLALCLRCAGLWRKYGIEFEDSDETSRKAVQGGGRGLKKRIDEELLRELIAANDAANAPPEQHMLPPNESIEPPKKKTKTDNSAAAAEAQKKKEKPPPPPKEPTPPPPPIVPTPPTWKVLPCAICKGLDNTISCCHCKLTVHRQCFGLRENEGIRADGVKWICEQCQNDRNPTVSTDYSCCLCLTEETLIDLVEPPRVSHKKKTDREREKERMEKELADAMRLDYRNKQLSLNRPPLPREPLKRTTGNNWVHVYCAMWSPEIRFSNAKALEIAEGFQLIPQTRFEAVCKLCKNKDHHNRVRENAGACINCFQCSATFHASCAFEAGYQFGFDVQPVKGSRKDSITTAALGSETGLVNAIVLCKEHIAKTVVHHVSEIVDDAGTTALQVYAQNYKQADLSLTGTVRKANLAQLTKDKGQQSLAAAQANSRRESGAHSIAAAVKRGARTSSVADLTKLDGEDAVSGDATSVADGTSDNDRRCVKCRVDVTPRWHSYTPRSKPQHDRPFAIGSRENSVPDRPGFGDPLGPGLRGPIDSPTSDQAPRQNIRFMAPGANGRAWDGMPDRSAPRQSLNADQHMPEQVNGHHPHHASPAHGSFGIGQPRPYGDFPRRPEDDVYHGHGPAPYQQSIMPGTYAHEGARSVAEPEPEYLCHKCFVKRKLDPSPTPPNDGRRSPRERTSNQFGSSRDWSRPSQPPPPLSIDQQFELWDTPPAPPPTQHPNASSLSVQPINGIPPPDGFPPPGYGPPHGPPPPGHSYTHGPPPPPPYGPQTNGYHGPSPSQHPIHEPPMTPHYNPPPQHERHASYGYQPHGPPGPPHYNDRRGPPIPVNGYGPSNSGPSPRPPPPPQPLHSPSYAGGPLPPHPHAPPPPNMRSDPGYTLSGIGAPAHSSPGAPFGRPRHDIMNGPPPHPAHSHAPPPHHHQPPHQGPPPPHQQSPHQLAAPPLPPQAPTSQPQMQHGPPPGHARPGEEGRPSTPHGGPANGGPTSSAPTNGVNGASASPNLMNLIHQ